MSSTLGKYIEISLFGESHGEGVGVVINGFPPGIEIDMVKVQQEMDRRAPGKTSFSTLRKEEDIPLVYAGILNGRTTGTPIMALVENKNQRSKDYTMQAQTPRPGHADFPAHVRYGGYEDIRGGGHFSGRVTAGLVFAGALCKQWLALHHITIHSHISQIGSAKDRPFNPMGEEKELLQGLVKMNLPLLNGEQAPLMEKEIMTAKGEKDSIGGKVECMLQGVPAGLGSPFFAGVEQVLSGLLFSVPGVKGVAFGDGFEVAAMKGSDYNDLYIAAQQGIEPATNHAGGVLGGITTGAPIVFTCAIRPPASIGQLQKTAGYDGRMREVAIEGRHDPCIVPRVLPVIEGVAAIALCELLKEKNSTQI